MLYSRLLYRTLAIPLITLLPLAAQSLPKSVDVAKLPRRFEQNSGQTAVQVLFFSRGKSEMAFFTREGVVLRMNGKETNAAAVRMTFADPSEAVSVIGEGPLEGQTNYFVGKDPSIWKTNVPSFSTVRYQEVYPGIDIVFYANGRDLEYDLVVKPNADLNRVRLNIEGATLKQTADGGITMDTSLGQIKQLPASVYQVVDGKKKSIPVQYILNRGQIRFVAGRYDRERELIVDPVMQYSTLLGGSDLDAVYKVAVDRSGYAYVTGNTSSTDFPTTTGAYRRTCVGSFGCNEAFVTKLNASGTGLIYSTFIGGSGGDQGAGIAIDSSRNAYITGVTSSPDFPGNAIGPVREQSAAFVAKLNATGTGLLYATRFGGSIANEGVAVAVDSTGHAYVTGHTESPDFPVTPGAFEQVFCNGGADCNGDWDSFVSKFTADGHALVYSSFVGGSGSDFTHSIALNGSGEAFVAGETQAANFPTTAGALQETKRSSGYSGFVVKLNADGTAARYSTYLGSSGGDSATGIAVDGSGNAYVTGATGSNDFPTTPGVVQRTIRGAADAFLSKLNPTGSALIYSTFLGGSSEDSGWAVTVNSSGYAYVLGSTVSSNFPTTDAGFQRVYNPGGCGDTSSTPCPDAFVAEFTPTGTALAFSSYLGGSATERIGSGTEIGGIALGPGGSIYIASSTSSLNFPTTNTAYKRQLRDSEDGFVVKLIPLCGLGSTTPSLTICTPGSNASVHSPVTIIAGTRDARAVRLLQVYVDGTKRYEAPLSAIDVKLSLATGTHRLTVQGFDTAGTLLKKTIYFTVN